MLLALVFYSVFQKMILINISVTFSVLINIKLIICCNKKYLMLCIVVTVMILGLISAELI